jgi:hypothetical protein
MNPSDPEPADLAAAMAAATTQTGESLATVTDRAPALLVFLRHFG